MGRFGRSDGPRVVGFDFGPPPGVPAAPAEAPAPAGGFPAPGLAAPPPPPAYAPPPPPPAYPPPPPAPAEPVYAAAPAGAPAYAAPAYAAPATFAPPGPPPPPPPPAFAGYGAPPAQPDAFASYAPPPPVPFTAPYVPPGGFSAPGSTYAPPGFGPPGAYPPPLPLPPSKKRRGGDRRVAGVLVFLLVVGARYGLRTVINQFGGEEGKRVERVALYTPMTVGSLPRIDSLEAMAFEVEVSRSFDPEQQPQVAVYGRGNKPRYFLAAGFGFEKTGEEVLTEATPPLLKDGAAVGEPVPQAGGLSCATLSYPQVQSFGSVCAWAGTRSNGAVVDFAKTDLVALAKVAAKARNEVDGRF